MPSLRVLYWRAWQYLAMSRLTVHFSTALDVVVELGGGFGDEKGGGEGEGTAAGVTAAEVVALVLESPPHAMPSTLPKGPVWQPSPSTPTLALSCLRHSATLDDTDFGSVEEVGILEGVCTCVKTLAAMMADDGSCESPCSGAFGACVLGKTGASIL